jgi:hypothetical protein
MIKKFKYFREEEEATFTNPSTNPDAYDNQNVTNTGGGRVPNYPVSNNTFRWIKSQDPYFASGFLSGYTESELSKIFLGTNLSASTYRQQRDLYDELGERQLEEQQAATDYFDGEYQTIASGYQAQYSAAIAAGNYFAADTYLTLLLNGPHVQEYNRLTNIYFATASQRSSILDNLANYITTGRISNPDPYQLDDPTVAAALERKKRQELIDKQIKQLAKDNERLKTQQAIRAAQVIVGIGFDIATAVAILNIFAGPADEAAIISGKIGTQEILERIAKEGGKEAAEKLVQKIPAQLADDVASVTEKLLRSKGGLGDDAVNMATKLDDALNSGNVETVKKVLQQADDLLYGKVTPRSPSNLPQELRDRIYVKPKPGPKKSGPWSVEGPLSNRRFDQLGRELDPKTGKLLKNSYEPSGKVISEERKIKIIKEIKKPFKVPEFPKKYKMNFSGKYSPQNTPDKTASEITDTLVASGNARGQKWRIKDKEWQGYETTERMNVVYDKVGHGDQAWEMIVNENARKKGWRNKNIQEKLNIIAHEKAMLDNDPNYKSPFIKEQETIQADKDPLFKKISKVLKKEIDYGDKPSRKGYPNEPPPEMVNGMHPDLVDGIKVADRFNKLDPQSAKAMPFTGNLHIDKKVKDARKKPK